MSVIAPPHRSPTDHDEDTATPVTRAGIDHACSWQLGRGLHELGAPLPIGHAVLTAAWMDAFVDRGETALDR